MVYLAWREDGPKLENNFGMALSRLTNLEKSLQRKNPTITQSYNEIIQDYEKKNYIRKLPDPKIEENQWFLPHFPVVREDKATTKVRVVFDAAAKLKGTSLNDIVLSGPKLQREVVDVLVRFRRAPVALTADISEMFLQVGLKEEDRRYHRFLWRNFKSSQDPDVYKFLRLPFGNTASPFCAQHVLHTHAQAHSTKYPEAAETVDNSMYVDDVLDSCETALEAKELRRQLSDLLDDGGFKLRKWLSNERSVVEEIPEADRLPGLMIQNGNLPTMKTLGVLWNAEKDVFEFQVDPPKISTKSTKRDVLNAIATLFDPLRFLSPFTVRAKILMQEIWTAGIDWDDALPNHLQAKWNKWNAELKDLSVVKNSSLSTIATPDRS